MLIDICYSTYFHEDSMKYLTYLLNTHSQVFEVMHP